MLKCSQIIMPEKYIVTPSNWQRRNIERNLTISRLYQSGRFTTEHIAKLHKLTPRAIQKIVKDAGLSRTIAESNVLMAPLKSRHRVRRRL